MATALPLYSKTFQKADALTSYCTIGSSMKLDFAMNQASFGKAIPVIASLDLARTLDFYKNVLGFRTRHFEDFSYGMAVRGETELHFWACNDKHIAENTSCYIRMADIAIVHTELSAKLPSIQGVVRTAWGMDELYVIDPAAIASRKNQPRSNQAARSR